MTRLFPALWRQVQWLLLFALSLAGQAQAATYTFRSDTYSWETSTNVIAWDRTCTGYPGDDDKATISFTGGFTFPFAGSPRSTVRVFSNGMLQFGTDTGFFRNFGNSTLPAGSATARTGCAAGATTLTMMAYWADLNPVASGSGGVTWEQKGTAPNRYVVVSWNSVFQYGTNTPYTFQIILFENGEFKYQYGNDNASGSNATIGVQVTNSDYTLYAFNSGYNANGTAIRWTVPSTTPVRVAEYQLEQYALNGTVGEVLDSSGNSQHGVRVGSAASTSSGQTCRGVEIPANTSTIASAIDTLVNPSSAVGAKGSVSFWFNSNVVWTNTTAALLFDATATATRPFYLMRNSGGALRFAVTDGAGASLVATSAANTNAANTWVHVTATWRLAPGSNQSALRIFVNGAQVAASFGTTNGSLQAGLSSLYIGDNRSSGTPSGGTPNSANGRMDEVRIYNYEQGGGDIAVDMAATHACPPPVDHYEVSLPSSSIACLGSTVTVTACATGTAPCTVRASGMFGQTATLSASGGALTSPLLIFGADGTASTTLSHPAATDGSIVTVTLGSEQTGATGARRCCPDGTACSVSDSCSSTFRTAGFVIAASANAAETTVAAQTAGTVSAGHVLRAVKSGTSTKACEAALTGASSVEWAYQCNNPATCSSGNLMTLTATGSTALPGNPATAVAQYGGVLMNFDSNGNAPFSFTLADVGQVSLFMRKTGAGLQTTPLTGRSNAFVTRPARFAIGNIRQSAAPVRANPGATDASGGVFVNAGESFSATITAQTSTGATAPNFGRETVAEGLRLTAALVQPAGGAIGTLTGGLVAGGAFSAGVATVSSLAWSEVGIVNLTPTVASGSYLGAGAVSGTASGNIGRFIPARFALGGATLKHRAALACTPASSFSYLGENFQLVFSLTAQNSAGVTTQNYAGSFAKFDPTSAADWNLGGVAGVTVFSTASGRLALGTATGAWAAGVTSGVTLSAAATRAAAADGPFNTSFGIAPVDSDGVALAAHDIDLDSTISGNDRTALASVALRHGRLRLGSAIGAADRPLALPVRAEYWNGSAWADNTLDNCTVVPIAALSFGNLRRTLTAADTGASAGITLNSGAGKLTLMAPQAGRRGTYDVALSLGSGAADASCLQPWTPGTGDAASAGANLAYLRGAWCGSAFTNDPAARATFGQQRGNDALVYRRELY